MSTFVDTSAFYALLDRDDTFHEAAKAVWRRLIEQDETLATSNYVLLESAALAQNRLGIQAVKAFHEDILPVVHPEWINASTHLNAISALLTAARRNLSLVDCTSFEVMRRLGIHRVFTFDEHFRDQGFQILNNER